MSDHDDLLRRCVAVMAFNVSPGCSCNPCQARRATIREACDAVGDPLPDVLVCGAEQELAARQA